MYLDGSVRENIIVLQESLRKLVAKHGFPMTRLLEHQTAPP
jgi:hypothetical protein